MTGDGGAKPLLKIKDLAQALGVDRKTIYNWLRAGTCPVAPIPHTKPPKWLARDVEALLAGDESRAA